MGGLRTVFHELGKLRLTFLDFYLLFLHDGVDYTRKYGKYESNRIVLIRCIAN